MSNFSISEIDFDVEGLELIRKRISDNDCYELSKILSKTSLTELNLASNQITQKGFDYLIKGIHKSKIKKLCLFGNKVSGFRNDFYKTGLTSLDLGCNDLESYDFDYLSHVLPLSKITNLDIGYNTIYKSDLTNLFQALPNTNLTSLTLKNTSPDIIDSLTGILPHTKLTSINISNNRLFSTHIYWIANAMQKSNLKEINLGLTNGGFGYDSGILFKKLSDSKLTSLDLYANETSNKNCILLANLLHKTQLKKLYLSNNDKINCSGFKALSEALNKSKLTTLNLSGNRILSKDYSIILKIVSNGKTLTDLNLCSISIGESGFSYLFKLLPQSKLKKLNLGHTDITEKNCLYLAKILHQTKLTDLNLDCTYIGDTGFIPLIVSLNRTKIKTLHLSNNKITKKSCIILSNVWQKTKLTRLGLRGNKIGNGGCLMICKTLNKTKLKYLDLECNYIKDEIYSEFNKLLRINRRKLTLNKKIKNTFIMGLSKKYGGPKCSIYRMSQSSSFERNLIPLIYMYVCPNFDIQIKNIQSKIQMMLNQIER